MDEDSHRRGGATVHEHFKRVQSAKFKAQSDKAKHFGESMAILAGDLAFVWAGECIQKTGNGKVIEAFYLMAEQTIYGQTLDILQDQGGRVIDTSHIIKYKTAYYSAIRPLQIGALLGKSSQIHLKYLYDYGLVIGLAFQLRDDNLDGKLTQKDFQKQASAYLLKANETISRMAVSAQVASVLKEVAQFVISRRA